MSKRQANLWLLPVLLVLIAGSASSGQAPTLPDNPLTGRLLFASRNCVLCHGIAGETPGIGPDLGRGAFEGSFLDLGAALWNHVPGMSVSFEDADLPWPELTRREVTELTAFLYFIDYLGRPGNPVDGAAVFRSKSCRECHEVGDRRSGHDLAALERFASPLFVAQAIWNHGPAMFETMRVAGLKTPNFAEGDLADLSAFIRQAARSEPQERMLLAPGNPNNGRELFGANGCSICHGPDARGGDGGPDLTQSDLHRSAEAIAGMMWNHASVMNDMMRDRGLGWPSFSTPELADLIAFLYFLPFADAPGDPDSGESVFASHGCAECHESNELAPHAGPDLASNRTVDSPEAFVAALWNHAPIMKEAILGEGRPWPELTGEDLRNLLAYLQRGAEPR